MKIMPARYLVLCLCASVSLTDAAEHRVSSAAEITQLMERLEPGDVVVFAEGTHSDQRIVFQGRGTEEKPVTLRAETPGKVIFDGASSLVVEGEHTAVSGLHFKDCMVKGDCVKVQGQHNRLTETAITGGTSSCFLRLAGTKNRVDHCYLADKTTDNPTMQIQSEGKPNHHRVDHNHFGPRPPLGRNGGETIRVGWSGASMSSSATVVEQNLFDRCDGEIEIISSKSCDNVYRCNTFLDCAGWLTLRHGNRCLVEGNFFLGKHKEGSGGVRIIGDYHTVINNYIEGVESGAFRITSGIPDSPLVGYFQARRCVVAFNTVVDCRGTMIDVSAGLGSSGRTLLPEDITIANNVFVPHKEAKMLDGTESASFHWTGNFLTADQPAPPHAGLRLADAKMRRAEDGLWRPDAASPVRKAAEGEFPQVKSDADGQPREGKSDAGCDQDSAAAVTNRPLTSKDAGPVWRR